MLTFLDNGDDWFSIKSDVRYLQEKKSSDYRMLLL